MDLAKYPNKAHQRAWKDGRRHREEGKPCAPLYAADDRDSARFRQAWIDGWHSIDAMRNALERCVDVMRRCDAENLPREGVEPCTDDEWDAALRCAGEVLASTGGT